MSSRGSRKPRTGRLPQRGRRPRDPLANVRFEMPRGVVHRYDRRRGFGFVHTERGSVVFFYVPTVDFVGPRGAKDLRVGAVVGYDVTLTAKGERITKMKILGSRGRGRS